MENKMKKAEEEDRISGLPDDVLCHILSFIPSEEAIATCFLSKRWRFLWHMVPAFDFNCTKPTTYKKVNKFLRLRTTQSITRFSLNIEIHQNCLLSYHILKWLLDATSNRDKVEHVDISLCLKISVSLPICMFTCTTIVGLKLKFLVAPYVPSPVCLLSLKSFHLDVGQSMIPISEFKEIFYGSPNLQVFSLKRSRDDSFKELKFVRSYRCIQLTESSGMHDGVTYRHVIQSDGKYDFIPDWRIFWIMCG